MAEALCAVATRSPCCLCGSGRRSPTPDSHTSLLPGRTQDLDLEAFTSQAFSLSPAQAVHPDAGASVGSVGAPLLLASLPDAPKIRVIVRKRPLNKKVRRVVSGIMAAASLCLTHR